MYCWKLIVLCFVLHQAYGLQRDFSLPDYNTALTRAIVDIVLNFYVKASSNINIIEASEDDESMNSNYDIINEILLHVQSEIVVCLEGYTDLEAMNRIRVHNILFVDTYKSFLKVFRLMTPENFNYQGFYLIVITEYTSDQYYMMQQIFDLLWAEYIINVNIIWATPMNQNEAIMFTYYPYTDFYCGKTYPIQLNQYRVNRWLHLHSVHFPNKIQNLYGCKLKVSTFITKPFMMTKRDENGDTITDGIDGILLRVLAQRMNFTVDLLLDDDLWGQIYDNGTVTGAVKLVVEKQANFTIGYFATTALRNKLMTSSYVYFTSNLIFIVPPGRLLTAFEKLFYPFKYIIWSLVTTIFLLGFLVIALLKFQSIRIQNFVYGPGNQSPCLNIINIFFGGSLTLLPTRNFARFLLGSFMIYCFIVRSSYQGALFKFMQSDSREQSVSTIEEMTVMLQLNEIPSIHDKILHSDFKGALLSSEEHVAYLNVESSPKRFFKHSPDVVFTFNLVIYMPKQSCLEQEFNNQILALTGGGFLESWALRFIDRDHMKEHKDKEPTQLNMSQLSGGYILLSESVFQVEQHTFLNASNQKRFHNVILIGNYDSFRQIYNCLLAEKFVYQGYFLFVLVEYYSEQYVEMTQALEDLWQIYIVNVNILMRSPLNNVMDMYTYYPFTQSYCGKVYPVLINQFINSQFQIAGNYFVDTISNMHQCSLTVATFNIPPLMMIEFTQDSFKLTGIEGYLLQAIARKLNFTIDLEYVRDEAQWGIIYPNGTSTGALKLVMDGAANLTIGKFSLSPIRNQYLDPTNPYYSSSLIMIIPPGKPFTSLENLMKPFKMLMWLTVICISLIAFTVIVILKWKFNETFTNFVLGSNNKHPFLNVLSVLLGVSLYRTPNRNFARTLLCMFMLFCLVIRSSYQGALFEILKADNRGYSVDTLDEMIAEDFDFYLSASLSPLISEIPKIYDRRVIIKSTEVLSIRQKTLQSSFKGTLLSSFDQVLYSNKLTYNNYTLNVCQEELFRFQYSIYFRKNSYFIRVFNDIINSFTSNGLVNEVARKYIDIKYKKPPYQKEPKQFQLQQLMGGFEILATGLLMATFTCVLEILSKRVQLLRRVFEIL
ncbi:unnamed protein product [Diamesa hyperborea]